MIRSLFSVKRLPVSLPLLISVVFISLSVLLLVNVDKRRSELEKLVGQVSIIAGLEADLRKCFDLSENGSEASFEQAIQALTEVDLDVETNPELTPLSRRIEGLKSYFKVSGVLMDFKPFRDELLNIYDECVQIKNEKRARLAILSAEIGSYWTYTHLLIVAACILSILLALQGVRSRRRKVKIERLTQENLKFIDSLVDCAIVCNAEGIITDVNRSSLLAFDYTEEEMIGMPVQRLYDDLQQCNEVRKTMLNTGLYKGEVVNRRKNGDTFLSFLSANMLYDHKGNEIGSTGISRDITRQKKQEERFEYWVENASDFIYMLDEQGYITFANQACEKLLGCLPEEVKGKHFSDLIYEEDREEVMMHYLRQFKSGTEQTYLEFRVINNTGVPIWTGQNLRISFGLGEDSQNSVYFAILRNLDESKRAQLNLEQSEANYRALFDHAKDLIQSLDENGNILFANKSWRQSLGYSYKELAHLNFTQLLKGEEKEEFKRILEKNGRFTDKNKDYRFTLMAKDGSKLWVEGELSWGKNEADEPILHAFFKDVTAYQKTKKALLKTQKNLRIIEQSINDVFFLYNIKSKTYEHISTNCKEVLGVEHQFFYNGGNFIDNYVFRSDRKVVKELLTQSENEDTRTLEYRLIIDGQIKWIEEKWFTIRDDEKEAVAISGVCRDITEVKEAYDTILLQNQEINQSILYAKNIQVSTLPTEDELKNILPNSFVINKAKDVLSGDFYIVDKVRSKDGVLMPVFVVGDCTGHGVPGGVLSLLCSGLITETLTNSRIHSPADALNYVREKLNRFFRSNRSNYILDGMDTAFCTYNPQTEEVYFAGANMSLYLLREGKVIEFKGDKQHVGYDADMRAFSHQVISVYPDDKVYLTTDGLVDQFGGGRNKKFLRKRFIDLLVEMEQLSMDEQKEKLLDVFNVWKGDREQTDDVIVMGVKF